MSRISIVVPVLNEAHIITDMLVHLIENSTPENIKEILVVDGGSSDGTQEMIKKVSSARLIVSEKGRARQMNIGAKNAKGDILYFLHADSFPPKDFDVHIIRSVNAGHLAGCFRMKFDHTHWWLRLASWLTRFKWRVCRGGDQSQFITTPLFEELGGYDERYAIYEDNVLIDKLYARKQFVVIKDWLTTSARRYEENGIWKLQFHFWTIHVKKRFGASAEELHRYYVKNIV